MLKSRGLKLKEINIIGFGVMGKQLISVFLQLGYRVTLWTHVYKAIEDVEGQISKSLRLLRLEKKGALFVKKNISELSNVPTIETVIEDLDAKINIRKQCAHIDAFFTNSSSIHPTEIGENVKGLHFFNPISIKLVELFSETPLIEGSESVIEDLEAAGYTIINGKTNKGYAGNFLLFSSISMFFFLIEVHHYNINELRAVYRTLFNQDLIQIINVVGVDTSLNIINELKKQSESTYIPQLLKDAVSRNILGKKNKTKLETLLNEFNL